MNDDDEEFDDDVSEESEEVVVKRGRSRKKPKSGANAVYDENYAFSVLGKEGLALANGGKDIVELLGMTSIQRDQELAKRADQRAQNLQKDELRQMLNRGKEAVDEDSDDGRKLIRKRTPRKRKKVDEESEDSYLSEESDDIIEESDGEGEDLSTANQWKGKLDGFLSQVIDTVPDDTPASCIDVASVQLRRLFVEACLHEPWFTSWLSHSFVKFPVAKLVDIPIYRMAKVERLIDGNKVYKLSNGIETNKLLEVSISNNLKTIKLSDISNHKVVQTELEYYNTASDSVLLAKTCHEYREMHKNLFAKFAYSARDVHDMVQRKQTQHNISSTLRSQIESVSSSLKTLDSNDVRNREMKDKLEKKLARLEEREEREKHMLLSETHLMIQSINQESIRYNQRQSSGTMKKKVKDSTSRMEIRREAFWLTPDQISAEKNEQGETTVKSISTGDNALANLNEARNGVSLKIVSPLSPNYCPFLHSANAIAFSAMPANMEVPVIDRRAAYFRRIGLAK